MKRFPAAGVISLAVITSISCAAFGQTAANMAERDTGPKHLVIMYQCPAQTRAAFRDFMVRTGVSRFEQWKQSNVVKEYHILFNWFVDAETWDMLALVDVGDYRNIDKWRQVERSSPGGLDPDGLALCKPTVTHAMDLLWHNSSTTLKSNPDKSVFLMIPYEYYPASSLEEYTKYVSGYVIPQFDRWIRDNVLVSYRIYANRFQTSRSWQALFVLEYRDTETFGEREKEVDKVKAELQKDEAWKSLGDRKLRIRTEKQTAAAEELVVR
jgi:hypothetical protein